jgi:hypothetical protein
MLKKSRAGLKGLNGPIYLPGIADLNRVLSHVHPLEWYFEQAGKKIASWEGITKGTETMDGYEWYCTCHFSHGIKEITILIPYIRRKGPKGGRNLMDRSASVFSRDDATTSEIISALESLAKELEYVHAHAAVPEIVFVS